MGSEPTRGAVLTAFAQSLIQFKARQLCRKPGFSRSDQEDLVQELTLRLLEKAHLYDPDRGASLDTFADRVIGSAVRMILRDRRRLKRAAGFGAMSLERSTVVIDGQPVLLCNLISSADRERVTLTVSHETGDQDLSSVDGAVDSLPSDLADIARRLMGGTVASVARELGTSRRQVYGAIQRIRQHFEAAGLGDL